MHCWGWNKYGQCDPGIDPGASNSASTSTVSLRSQIDSKLYLDVSAGGAHTCFTQFKRDAANTGRQLFIGCSGLDDDGQIQIPLDITNIVAI